jgi:hypothetical protein
LTNPAIPHIYEGGRVSAAVVGLAAFIVIAEYQSKAHPERTAVRRGRRSPDPGTSHATLPSENSARIGNRDPQLAANGNSGVFGRLFAVRSASMDAVQIIAAYPFAVMLVSAGFLSILRNTPAVQALVKSRSQRTPEEQLQVDRGSLRMLFLELMVFVPVSAVLVLLISPLFHCSSSRGNILSSFT